MFANLKKIFFNFDFLQFLHFVVIFYFIRCCSCFCYLFSCAFFRFNFLFFYTIMSLTFRLFIPDLSSFLIYEFNALNFPQNTDFTSSIHFDKLYFHLFKDIFLFFGDFFLEPCLYISVCCSIFKWFEVSTCYSLVDF